MKSDFGETTVVNIGGGDTDLSDYYTKDEINVYFSDYYQKSEIEEIADTKEDVSKKLDNIRNYDLVEAKGEYPSVKAVIDYVEKQDMVLWQIAGETFTTKDEVDDKIGNIDTALEAIIAIQDSILGVSK